MGEDIKTYDDIKFLDVMHFKYLNVTQLTKHFKFNILAIRTYLK